MNPFAMRVLGFEALEGRQMLHGAGGEVHDHAPEHTLTDHIHAQLTILIEGQEVAIPANIGVSSSAFLSFIHTHDASGLLHIHPISATEVPTEFITLGDFFDTWRTNAGLAGNNPDSVLSDSQLMASVEDSSHIVRMYVNGVATTAFDDYVIHDGDNIVLSYLPIVQPASGNPIVTVNTNLGPIPIELFTPQAPGTVDNFLDYVNDGDYANSIFHRLVPGFVAQGGGFTTTSIDFTSAAQFGRVPTEPPITNEPGISNVRGTVAMAKLGGDPNSATSQFFVNLNNNSANLDNQNGGFTVFGRVLDMTIPDLINTLTPTNIDATQGLTEVPLSGDNKLVVVQSVAGEGTVRGTTYVDTDRDGTRDAGEAGLAGFTVFVDANNNGVLDTAEQSTTSAAGGSYSFLLVPGTHTIRQQPLTGFEITAPASASHTVTVQIGRAVTADFGNFQFSGPALLNDTATTDVNTAVVLNVLANDTDPDGDTLTIESFSTPANGSVTDEGEGRLRYSPAAGFEGVDTFTYSVRDAQGNVSTASVTVTVGDPPQGTADHYCFDGESLTVAAAEGVLENDSSQGSGTLEAILVTGPAEGSLSLSADGSFVYTPGSAFDGLDSFTYRVRRGSAESGPVTVALESASHSFVVKLYEDFVGRTPAEAEVQAWLERLDEGSTREEIVRGILGAAESRRDTINGFYQRFLGREGEEQGLTYWLDRYNGGEPQEMIVAGFLNSPEYFRRNGDSNEIFLTAVYDDLLDFEPAGDARSFWQAKLAGGSERLAVIFGLFDSDDFHEMAVGLLYQDLLRRNVDPASMALWQERLATQDFLDELALEIASSEEYFECELKA